MSDKIEDATQAMDAAQKAMDKAGWTYYVVTGVRMEDSTWIVEFSSFGGKFQVRVSATTGDVVDLRQIQ